MRSVVQRVSKASVVVEERVVGEIGQGLLVLLGVSKNDTKADADYLAEKVAGLRVFEDSDGKMNCSVADAGGAVLAVSQFTLYGDVRRGKRPSFDDAARPERARELYDQPANSETLNRLRTTGSLAVNDSSAKHQNTEVAERLLSVSCARVRIERPRQGQGRPGASYIRIEGFSTASAVRR